MGTNSYRQTIHLLVCAIYACDYLQSDAPRRQVREEVYGRQMGGCLVVWSPCFQDGDRRTYFYQSLSLTFSGMPKLTIDFNAQLAQWAGSRADLFPSLLCDRLGTLHSHGKPHAFEHTKKVIELVFQRPFDEVFEEFDEVPIGTGAIAQVRVYHLYILNSTHPLLIRSIERHSNKTSSRHLTLVPGVTENPQRQPSAL
jgi:hypothetical protein